MSLHSFEQSPLTRGLDAAVYLYLLSSLGAFLMFASPAGNSSTVWLLIVVGLLLWTFLEYILHRFVLHGPAPFSTWHAAHHRQPRVAMGAPTLLSLSLIIGLVFLPALWWQSVASAVALTFGMATGYTVYSVLHHWLHQPGAAVPWLRVESDFHARHHQSRLVTGNFGVTNRLWDQVFRTVLQLRSAPCPASLPDRLPAVHDGL
ncbi:sterol desaturase family protein [Chitinimonas sp. BJYL2]|uniref:sterol desaturase family protein n=1 Tax=Chitinimonas sp. BJYL2 TaxID=2976696 RepID=UPI0022B5CDE3|nr:sterol desaturase family protein [Chitinimonas sp. BJYL2]